MSRLVAPALHPAPAPFTLARPGPASPGAAIPAADVAVFGAPLDRTASFRRGAGAGPTAVRVASEGLETYSPHLDADLEDLRLTDLGDLDFEDAPMADCVEAIATAMESAATGGGLPVMLGGEHTVSLGAFRGARRVHPEAHLLQIDAHCDLREQWEGEAVTHASWLFHAGEEHGFERIAQVGVRSGAREEWPLARERLLHCSYELALPVEVRERLTGVPIHLTVDIDVLDPATAPGTGSPEPGGPSFAELEAFLHSIAPLNVVSLDLVEIAPSLDPSGATAAAAAKLARDAMLMWAQGPR